MRLENNLSLISGVASLQVTSINSLPRCGTKKKLQPVTSTETPSLPRDSHIPLTFANIVLRGSYGTGFYVKVRPRHKSFLIRLPLDLFEQLFSDVTELERVPARTIKDSVGLICNSIQVHVMTLICDTQMSFKFIEQSFWMDHCTKSTWGKYQYLCR